MFGAPSQDAVSARKLNLCRVRQSSASRRLCTGAGRALDNQHHEAGRRHPYQRQADAGRAGFRPQLPPQQPRPGRVRGADPPRRGFSRASGARPDAASRRPCARVGPRRPPVVHAAPLRHPRVSGTRASRWSPTPTCSLSAMSASSSPATLQGKAIWCTPAARLFDKITDPLATSVMLLDCGKLPHWRFAEELDSAVAHRDRLSRLDQPQARGARHDRPARARVERFRPSDAGDQAASQHQAADPAVEDRTCRSTSRSASARGCSTSRCRSSACSRPSYTPPPRPQQEAYFYALLAEALDAGSVTARAGRKASRLGHVRPDFARAHRALSRPFWPAEQAAPKAA